ncbi:GNAT family N-acetyltransferase [Tessaracoccus flavus]|uniref:GNAT family N-acetyltransferase n=1 Tax=Tessaracoccus flavus TaxID=1610493 RepID=A0A1Q2CGA0_9ACTN|nr:GNAT family N-acetyltransferase [Tessaracoccus flavus]AQP45133.1 GNAT family N-acetyltransferase [Tessaracoccus flavus]SDY55500.1 phosphinothricin acetyltransferase [Tessaracoccus flavus]
MPTIRPARLHDLSAITEIYNEAGVGTTASWALEPVTLEDRRAWFMSLTRKDYPVLVLVDADSIVGFASYGPFRPLAGWAPTVEHSVYIREGYRSAGGGRMLLNALIDYARGRGVRTMVGVIDGANDHSVAFHERMGFTQVGRIEEAGLKFGQWHDAVFMARKIDDGPPS